MPAMPRILVIQFGIYVSPWGVLPTNVGAPNVSVQWHRWGLVMVLLGRLSMVKAGFQQVEGIFQDVESHVHSVGHGRLLQRCRWAKRNNLSDRCLPGCCTPGLCCPWPRRCRLKESASKQCPCRHTDGLHPHPDSGMMVKETSRSCPTKVSLLRQVSKAG